MSTITDISWCNIAQIIGETNRFLFHVMLVHIVTCVIEGKKAIMSEEFFRTLIITAVAITMYHIFFRKIVEPKIEKMKLICYTGKDRDDKKKEIEKLYPVTSDSGQKDTKQIKRKYGKTYSKEKTKDTHISDRY
jgi:hypothetical protein